MNSRVIIIAAACLVSGVMAGCSNGVPLGPSTSSSSTSSGSSGAATPPATTTTTPSTPTSATTAAVAYNQDLAPVFAANCVPCHGGGRAAGGYSMTTYAGVMAAVRAGNTSSALVIVTQPGGLMYSFLTGDGAGKSAMIRTWVLNGAPQSR